MENKINKDEISIYSIFFIMCVVLGVFTIGKYIYNMIYYYEDMKYWISQLLFISLQTLLDITIVVLMYVAFKNKLSLKFIIGSACLLFFLNEVRYVIKIHAVISSLNLYWGIFKTGFDGSVTTWQYTRIAFIIIALITCILSTLFTKRSILKFFVLIFTVAFYVIFVFLHFYVSFKPSKEVGNLLGNQMEIIEYSSNPKGLCDEIGYKCHLIKKGEVYNYAQLRKYNLSTSVNADNLSGAVAQLNLIINNSLNYMFEHKEKDKFFQEGAFNADLFRAIIFHIKRVDDETMLVILDTYEMSGATETYLLILNLYLYVFLFFWISILTYIYKIHVNMGEKVNKLIE